MVTSGKTIEKQVDSGERGRPSPPGSRTLTLGLRAASRRQCGLSWSSVKESAAAGILLIVRGGKPCEETQHPPGFTETSAAWSKQRPSSPRSDALRLGSAGSWEPVTVAAG